MLRDRLEQMRRRLPADQQNLRGFSRALFLPCHTYLFVLSFLLFWYFHRQYVASVDHMIVAGALISGIFVAVRAIALSWVGNVHKAALAVSLLALLLLFFSDFRGALAEMAQSLHLSYGSRLRYELPLFSLLFGVSIAWVVRTRLPLSRASQAMDAFAFVLAAMVATQILAFKPLSQANSRIPELEKLTPSPASTNAARDIYLIVADSRTSSAALNRYWNYDDSGFTSELSRLGFQCASNAASEYSSTPQCISTLMNMETPAVPANHRPKQIVSYLTRTIRDSRLTDFLARQGYDIVNLSLFDLRDQPRFFSYFDENSYISIFTATLPGVIWHDCLDRGYLKRVNESLFAELKQLPTRDSGRPRFVYAHLMTPHYPFFYDRDGQENRHAHSPSDEDHPHAYLEQLIYADRLLLETAHSILTKSRTPPIIIIRGDHGFRYLPPPDRDAEACQVFFAAYFPEGGSVGLPSKINHAVVFRDVLNRYFGTGISLETGPVN